MICSFFSLIFVWTNGRENTQDASDLRCHHAHYGVNVMSTVYCLYNTVNFLQIPHNRPLTANMWGRDVGCLFWFLSLIYVLLLSLHVISWYIGPHYFRASLYMGTFCLYKPTTNITEHEPCAYFLGCIVFQGVHMTKVNISRACGIIFLLAQLPQFCIPECKSYIVYKTYSQKCTCPTASLLAPGHWALRHVKPWLQLKLKKIRIKLTTSNVVI